MSASVQSLKAIPTYLDAGNTSFLADMGKRQGFDVIAGMELGKPDGFKWTTILNKNNPKRRTVMVTLPDDPSYKQFILTFNEKTGGFDVSPSVPPVIRPSATASPPN